MAKLLTVAALAVAGLLALAWVWPRAPDPAAAYLALQRAELQAEQERAAAARDAALWAWLGPAFGGLGLLAVGGALAVAGDVYRRRRRPLVALGPVVVDRARLHAGGYDGLLTGALAGHYTAQIERARAVPPPHTYSPHQVYQSRELAPGAAPAGLPAAPPAVPTFAALLAAGTIGPGRPLLLGYGADGPLFGELRDWRSGAIAGLPGAGKTTTQRMIACQAALAGARLVILDPHADAGADSLAGTLAPLAPAFLCAPASRPAAMLQALRLVQDIMEARLAGAPLAWPLFVFVDEWTALASRSELAGPLTAILAAVAQEGRKTLTQACLSGQLWGSEQAHGTGLRDSLASTYVHRMKRNQARLLLPTEDARRAETLPTGAAVLWRADGTLADVVIPLTTAADVAAVGRLLTPGAASAVPSGSRPAASGVLIDGAPWWEAAAARTAPGRHSDGTPTPTDGTPPDAYTARVVALFLAGKTLKEICELVHPEVDTKSGGRPYRELRDRLEDLIRQELARRAAAGPIPSMEV